MRVVSEARALLTEDYRPGEAIYLAGEAAYVTLDAASPVFADMQIQPPRPASFKMLGDGGSLHVGVPNSIMAEVTAQPRVKFYLLADAYLHYMRKLRGDFLFVGGASNDTDTNLEFFMVNDGRVTQVVDKRLPAMSSSDFPSQFLLALNDVLNRSGITDDLPVYWAYPLELPDRLMNAYKIIPVPVEKLNLKRLRLRALRAGGASESPLRSLAGPLVGLLVGGLVAAALVGFQWIRYTDLQKDFDQEVQGVSSVYEQGSSMLNTLSSQQRMLDMAPAQGDLIKRWTTLASSSVKSDAEVRRIAVFGEGSKGNGLGGRTTDFEMDLAVPVDKSVPDRVFAKQLLTRLVEASGYEMWLRPGEIRTTDGVRIVEIEGVWNVQ